MMFVTPTGWTLTQVSREMRFCRAPVGSYSHLTVGADELPTDRNPDAAGAGRDTD
jgi:hypothetical protein